MNKIKEFYKKHEGAIWLGIGTIGMATTLVGMYYIGYSIGANSVGEKIRLIADEDKTNTLRMLLLGAEKSDKAYNMYNEGGVNLDYLDSLKNHIVSEGIPENSKIHALIIQLKTEKA